MDAVASPTAPGGAGHVHVRALPLPDGPRCRGGAMAEHRLRTARKHGRLPFDLSRRGSVPEHVDLAVHSVQTPGSKALLNGTSQDPERVQLRSGQQAERRRQIGRPRPPRGRFCTHWMHKPPRGSVRSPSLPRETRMAGPNLPLCRAGSWACCLASLGVLRGGPRPYPEPDSHPGCIRLNMYGRLAHRLGPRSRLPPVRRPGHTGP